MQINDHKPVSTYVPAENRYGKMNYQRCGKSGLLLPRVSLGLWHNFGDLDNQYDARQILRCAFDNGITHFDLANNYGPPYGSAEENFGKIFAKDFKPYRDELIISTKAGYDMWAGPYGNFGSKKYLTASIDQSLKRMNIDYVDIFYHHRPDPETPLEETMNALDLLVKQGKALYVGISNYDHEQTAKAAKILRSLNTPFIINQVRYSMLDRWIESNLIRTAEHEGIGLIAFSPLAQGLLTDKYLKGIPDKSRISKAYGYLNQNQITPDRIAKLMVLNEIATKRNQSLAQMALAWVLRHPQVTSVLIGASSTTQLTDSIQALEYLNFSTDELSLIESVLNK